MKVLYLQVLYFTIYSFLGWVCESTYCSIGQKKLVNRGFLNGPFCPIYGFGALLVISILSPFVNNIPILFIASIIVTSTLEYITSYVLEKIFHMSWWDYSTYKYNINGRVCLKNSLMFGVMSLFVMLVVHPAVDDFVAKINTNVAFVLSILFGTYFIVDTIITASTILHLNERLEKLHTLHEDLLEKKKRHLEVVKGHLQASLANQIEELGLSKYSPAEMEELLSSDFRGNFIKEEHKVINELEFEIKSLSNRIEELKSKGHGVLRRRVIKAFPNMKSLKHKSLLEEIKENIDKK